MVLQSRTLCADASPLASKLHALPCRRNVYTWKEYLEALLPILALALEVRRHRSLRRQAFRSHQLRDKALDRICAKITAGSPQATLVAFGGANSCSTGFGHAPAPQGRLRWRLDIVHGARITIVDEFRTSQRCCRCQGELKHGAATITGSDGSKVRRQLHHVLFCEHCTNNKGAKQFWHRDFNAAKNILACYVAAATGADRPEGLRRPKKQYIAAPLALR